MYIKLTIVQCTLILMKLLKIQIDDLIKEDRSTLCKFRISAHSLEIEKGRYYNIPLENRVCLSCKAGKVENELHLFLDCPSYAHLRQDFF